MLNVLVPMAGSGKRFKEAGYALPKPLIDVAGAPMIDRAVQPITHGLERVEHRLIFVVSYSQEILSHPSLKERLVVVTPPTNGALSTCLTARHLIDTDDPLLIANCDQIVHLDSVDALISTSADAAVLTMPGDGSKKWSYAQVDSRGTVTRVVEKEVISDRATCGLYWFRTGREFVRAADRMVLADDRVNGEFYVAPVLNYLRRSLSRQAVVEVKIEDHGGVFHGLGTPEDLEKYLALQKV